MAHPYNWILFDHKIEWHTDICYNMDETGGHYTNLKSPSQKIT